MVQKIKSLGGNPLSKIAVLCVDNDDRISVLLKRILESFGFEDITVAHNGREALSRLDERKYDLIISDWQMEEMDGIAFINYLRKNPRSPDFFIPVIMLSGRAEMHNIKKARDSGITEFLAKPFEVTRLRERIISVFERPREFVFSGEYSGPSRRRKSGKSPDGKDRRKE